ncbi:hypothetical protein [Actinophytocola oryzae]|uniref:Uncharacterized protein n=1 Tax=Actinophytocola oryzae TaxID=502181 RepID=A0A4R7VMQ5_9PSEU|nr:hypothetical protein [Actinophytocola oryzae]TDV50900.1 hypothetical protein CLV71_106245 [Actinophytocola oryzae]
MSWQERLRELGDQLVSGEVTTAQYRTRSEQILAEADREAADDTQPAPPPETGREKVPIPVSAAWEAPSGEMTQIVGTTDKTTVVKNSIAEALDQPDDQPTSD